MDFEGEGVAHYDIGGHDHELDDLFRWEYPGDSQQMQIEAYEWFEELDILPHTHCSDTEFDWQVTAYWIAYTVFPHTKDDDDGMLDLNCMML